MLFDEDDIDFTVLSSERFEELCLDLLLRYGFQNLTWRQGGGDSGRDIEGTLTTSNSLVGDVSEKWFFECKRYAEGVPPDQLNSKIAWADAEKPKHLVFIVSSYLSNGARIWLDKIRADKYYIIHLIEGKRLKQIVLRHEDIASEYFIDIYGKLLLDSRRTWLIHGLLPSIESVATLCREVMPQRLSEGELAFLWCAGKLQYSETNDWILEHEPFTLDPFYSYMAARTNTSSAIIHNGRNFEVVSMSVGHGDWDIAYPNVLVADIEDLSQGISVRAMYSYVWDNEGDGLEVLVKRTSSYNVEIRHFLGNTRKEYLTISNVLISHTIHRK